MKINKTYTLIVLFLLFTFLTVSSAAAQSGLCDCYGNGGRSCEVQISSQADLDALALDNCTSISGSLTINAPDLENLNGLQSIETINYDLIIRNNILLTDLDGLTNLWRVGWNLYIIENDVLESIAGLDHLALITGDKIEISWNPGLDDLTPLYGTYVKGGYIVIQYNQILSMLNAFNLIIQLSPPNGIFNGSSLITDNGLTLTDSDNDGIMDSDDNCLNDPNPGQSDCDSDGLGDACDPDFANADADGDGIDDSCDACPNDADNDADSDGHCADEDNCPSNCNSEQLDGDGDGIGDVCDDTTGCDGCGTICEIEC